jgi:IclR family transcriptional regulator, acetate operon repressor
MSATLDRSLDILEALVPAPQGLTLAQLCKSCGVTKATAHRLLAHLAKRGFVYQSETGWYALTMQLPVLASRFLENLGFLDVCQPALERLAALSGELVRLAWLDGDRLVWIAEAQGARPGLRYDGNLGRIATLHITAVGKTWLAALDPDAAVREVRAQGAFGAKGLGPKAIRAVPELLAELAKTRRRGYALAIDEVAVGTAAVAVPMVSTGTPRQFLGALAVVGPTARLPRSKLTELVPALEAAASTIVDLWPIRAFCRRSERNIAAQFERHREIRRVG